MAKTLTWFGNAVKCEHGCIRPCFNQELRTDTHYTFIAVPHSEAGPDDLLREAIELLERASSMYAEDREGEKATGTNPFREFLEKMEGERG